MRSVAVITGVYDWSHNSEGEGITFGWPYLMERILVVEDTDSLRDVLVAVLACEGYEVQGAATAEEGLALLTATDFALVISDLKLPGISGIEFLTKSRELKAGIPVLVMTAYGTIDIAVEAMKLGAVDFITKPFDPGMLVRLIEQVMEHRRIVDRTTTLSPRRPRQFVTQNKLAEQVLEHARKVAPLTSPVLILGESGTGKELIARYIHDHSRRADQPFIAVNCSSMPSDLLESEFFGHEAGAFTGATAERPGLFEIANHGTIFLDEIGTMPAALQVKLLRTLQESEIKRLGSSKISKIDVRVISATNANLELEIKNQRFREDLFYRLGVMILEIPALRERHEDIPLLVNYFVKFLSAELKRSVPVVTRDAMTLLEAYSWPGNVRELENTLERAMIFYEGPITADTLELRPSAGEEAIDAVRSLTQLSNGAAKKAEVEAISRVLAETRGNKSKAARILGISYKTLLNKVKEYELERR